MHVERSKSPMKSIMTKYYIKLCIKQICQTEMGELL
jgi:hypothetical protein